MIDRETGRSRGFGFVEMPNPDEARQAIEQLNGANMAGRPLTVNEARPKEPRSGGGFGGGGGGGGWRSGGGGGGGGGRGGFDPEVMQDIQKKTRALREEAKERVVKVLTADQRKMWEEMTGPAFDTTKLIPQRPGRDN
jgi:RNA recognition motif-containing protein